MKRANFLIRVFGIASGCGGNPVPVVLDAQDLSDDDMRDEARAWNCECVFVTTLERSATADFHFRYWVPNHEMEMCGHATLAALWLLARLGRISTNEVKIQTQSGIVYGHVLPSYDNEKCKIEIFQAPAQVRRVPSSNHQSISAVLGVPSPVITGRTVENVSTGRWKTLVHLDSPAILNALQPDYSGMQTLCESIESTGLYPWAFDEKRPDTVHARQFPKSSGYPEDPATGIAAASLGFVVFENWPNRIPAKCLRVLQGHAMGQPSEIFLRFVTGNDEHVAGCWLSGQIEMMSIDA